MPASEAKVWKEAFEALLKKEIGQTATEVLDGGPAYAVPLVLIPVDALHEGPKYSAERGQKYRARLKQLTAEDVSLWQDKLDKFGGTKLDAAVNIVLLDDYFDNEKFQRDKFKAAVEQQQEKKKAPAKETGAKDELQGIWQLLSLEFDGLSVGEGRSELESTRLLMEQKSLTLFYTPETVLAQSATRQADADFTVDATQSPKVIMLTWKECPWNGKKNFVRKAIYAVEGDRLRLCLSRKDDDKEAPTEFSAKAGSERLLWTFKRVSPARKEGAKKDAQQGQVSETQKEKPTKAPSAQTAAPDYLVEFRQLKAEMKTWARMPILSSVRPDRNPRPQLRSRFLIVFFNVVIIPFRPRTRRLWAGFPLLSRSTQAGLLQ
jgi:uncharacterized protein (TIGR03067 family)